MMKVGERILFKKTTPVRRSSMFGQTGEVLCHSNWFSTLIKGMTEGIVGGKRSDKSVWIRSKKEETKLRSKDCLQKEEFASPQIMRRRRRMEQHDLVS